MKDKKKLIIAICAAALVLVLAVILVVLFLKQAKVVVTFDTDGGTKVEEKTIKKGEKITLPTTAKTGYNFLGWYIDNKKVENSVVIKKNTTIKAKWEKIREDAKTMVITFDSNGGSKVDPLTVECDKELTLPSNPTRDGYTFSHWALSNGNIVNNGGIIKCQNTTLYAKWEKNKEYTCPEGYKLSGTKCLTCPQGTTLSGTKCLSCPEGYKLSGNSCVYSEAALEKCPENTIGDSCLTNPQDPVSVCSSGTQNGDKCYVASEEETEEACTEAGKTWESDKCYTVHTNFTEQCPSGTTPHENKCYSQAAKEKYCNEGLTLSNGACTKTANVNSTNATSIDATEKQ